MDFYAFLDEDTVGPEHDEPKDSKKHSSKPVKQSKPIKKLFWWF